jgi:undecaprenyl-diphosphatase
VIIGAGIVLLVLFIGFTRLYLGAHYLTDVVGGFAAGWIWLSTCVYALRFARHRLGERLDRSPPTAV